MKTLLILGNGFDLNCDLKSKFSDFFQTKLTTVSYNGDSGLDLKNKSKENIWYLVFLFAFFNNRLLPRETDSDVLFPSINNDDPLWMDVESYIKLIMTTSNKTLGKYMKSTSEKSFLDIFEYANKERNDYKNFLSEHYQFLRLQMHFIINEEIKKGKTMAEYLYHQLKAFEDDFRNYILKELKNNESDYNAKSKALLKEFREYKGEYLYILSFNYTSPGASVNDTMNHVHGDLHSSTIIGYDSSEISSSNNPSLMLTKGWQKLFLGSHNASLPDKETINCIKFYGHSLGEQDYSYFHALFDYYDVYSRSVTLIFYYSEYEDTPEKNETIRANYISKVYALLDKYVEESEKENKRRTFTSRLQLENRLKIKKIQSSKE